MNNDKNRVAHFTSSKIAPLTLNGKGKYGFGAGAITYIEERAMELELGRGIDLPINTWEVSWGKVWEVYVHWQLGSEYKICIDQSKEHPIHYFWSGAKDFKITDGIAELKCYQLRKFYKYAKCLQKQSIELLKENFKDEYWQIVSNACIDNVKFGEAIAFMPTEEMLLEMKQMIEETDYIEKQVKDDPFKYKFIVDRPLWDLPFIPEHSKFPSMVKFRFEVPQEDKDFLTERVIKANELLTEIVTSEIEVDAELILN